MAKKTQESIISVKNLVKTYRKAKTPAVDDISFSVEQGEFFALLGPNGAGKTTTISILTTTLAKSSGTLKIAGFNVDSEASQVRQNIGVIFQNPSLDLNLTAEENIRFHVVLYGLYPFRTSFSMMPDTYKKRVLELAEVLDLKEDIFKQVKTFSGGMKRKLEIIRSLTHHPKVLFLDEPTSGLDPLSRKNLWNYLKSIRKTENTTIFLTTHYLEEAEEADTILIINKGKIVSFGTPTDIKKDLIDEYMFIDAKNRSALRKDLEKLQLAFQEENGFKITLANGDAQKIIKAIDTPLTKLLIHAPTIEDAYLDIIQKENDENN